VLPPTNRCWQQAAPDLNLLFYPALTGALLPSVESLKLFHIFLVGKSTFLLGGLNLQQQQILAAMNTVAHKTAELQIG
jgi:hypothetical protein